MLATVNSRRRSVSRGPGDQARGVVTGWGGGEEDGERGEEGGSEKAKGMHAQEEAVWFRVTFITRFSPSFGGILRDASDFSESGTAGKSVDERAIPES